MDHQRGKIIFLNGASSSGKSTVAVALQEVLKEPFWHYSIDHVRDSKVIPWARINGGEFDWKEMREPFFEGFHRCLPALAIAGNNLLVEHIVETALWRDRLLVLLRDFDVFFVGVHCPLPELERREQERGDRQIGEAKRDFETIHQLCQYDLEIDSTFSLIENRETLHDAWKNRQTPSAFQRMRSEFALD